jgi:hypothetical protein
MRVARPRRDGARTSLLAAWFAAMLAAACGEEPPPAAAPLPAIGAPAAPLPPLDQANPAVRVDRVAVDEATLGVPLYPRATIEGDGASQVATEVGTTLMLAQRSPDPARDVAVFYREAMRVLAHGKELAEIGGADDGSTTWVLGDPTAGRAVQVRVSAEGVGSRIQIVSTRSARR